MADGIETAPPGREGLHSGWTAVAALALTALAVLGFLWIREQRRAAAEPPGGTELRLRLDLNAAGVAELQLVPGVGASRAERVVEARRRRGGFRRLAELDEPALLGPGAAERLAPYFQPLPGDPR
ncbi:MAG TPA: helix-hairpin-helix domain-containing protein [Planctomycetota bacterium]|nr:helix-hairpin-helix domain-containing protein [Planctomycetota bacterium]